ncbi:hypothetical protein BU23DRAFT_288109 [Bimuria novae-zelandiae CBS 107.79]|uniref:Uncharacterized protein n=1 Tax=Bimuria novae-zelandiae CBS 107.79 TaxID=1447943 RepID=A0A6A5UV04_9PLEO|nr:hypothetical protein BU23DRAFT_288109 [Bimuria novae-zelandiae CBS 107.79]
MLHWPIAHAIPIPPRKACSVNAAAMQERSRQRRAQRQPRNHEPAKMGNTPIDPMDGATRDSSKSGAATLRRCLLFATHRAGEECCRVARGGRVGQSLPPRNVPGRTAAVQQFFKRRSLASSLRVVFAGRASSILNKSGFVGVRDALIYGCIFAERDLKAGGRQQPYAGDVPADDDLHSSCVFVGKKSVVSMLDGLGF